MATNSFYDFGRNHRWAIDLPLEFGQSLQEAVLRSSVPGTCGSVLDTLRHLVDSGVSCHYRLTGVWPGHSGEMTPGSILLPCATAPGNRAMP